MASVCIFCLFSLSSAIPYKISCYIFCRLKGAEVIKGGLFLYSMSISSGGGGGFGSGSGFGLSTDVESFSSKSKGLFLFVQMNILHGRFHS